MDSSSFADKLVANEIDARFFSKDGRSSLPVEIIGVAISTLKEPLSDIKRFLLALLN